MDHSHSPVTSSVGARSTSNSEQVSLKSYVKDIFDRIDRSQQSLALGSRNCEFDHELQKVKVAHNMFDEMPEVNFGVGYKVFDELPNWKLNPTSGSWFRELNGLKQISSVKEYHETFISILDGSQVLPEYGLSCFIDGLNEDIRCMVMLFKPQSIHEAYCLAKLHEATLVARRPTELISTTSLPTQNRPQEEYPQEHRRSVGCYVINPDFQAFSQSDTRTILLKDVSEAENEKDLEKLELEDFKVQKDGVTQVECTSPQNLSGGVANFQGANLTKFVGRNTLQMTSHPSYSQDVCLSSKVMKDNHEQKYPSEEDKHVGINGSEETCIGIELLINKDEGATKQSTIYSSVAKTFGWKPGLQRWLTLIEAFPESCTAADFAPIRDVMNKIDGELKYIKPHVSVELVINHLPESEVARSANERFIFTKRGSQFVDNSFGSRFRITHKQYNSSRFSISMGGHLYSLKFATDLIVAEFFEWKPGLEFWLVDKRRKYRHGLNKHGVADALRNGSLMVMVKVHPKFGIESFAWQYLGRKYVGSRSLQGVADVQHHFRLENAKFDNVTEMMWGELQFEIIKKVDLILVDFVYMQDGGTEISLDRRKVSTLFLDHKKILTSSFELRDANIGHVIELGSVHYGSRCTQQKCVTMTIEENKLHYFEIILHPQSFVAYVIRIYKRQEVCDHDKEDRRKELAGLFINHVLSLNIQIHSWIFIQRARELLDVDEYKQIIGEPNRLMVNCACYQNVDYVFSHRKLYKRYDVISKLKDYVARIDRKIEGWILIGAFEGEFNGYMRKQANNTTIDELKLIKAHQVIQELKKRMLILDLSPNCFVLKACCKEYVIYSLKHFSDENSERVHWVRDVYLDVLGGLQGKEIVEHELKWVNQKLMMKDKVETKSNSCWSDTIACFLALSGNSCIKDFLLLYEVATNANVYVLCDQLKLSDHLYFCNSMFVVVAHDIDEVSGSLQDERYRRNICALLLF